MRNTFDGPPEFHQDATECAPCRRQIRCGRDRPLKQRQAGFRAVYPVESVSEFIEKLRIRRVLRLKRRIEFSGFRILARLPIRSRSRASETRIRGFESGSLLIGAGSLRVAFAT